MSWFRQYVTKSELCEFFAVGGSTVDIGSTVKATILDVVKKDRLVDLSLKPELVNRYTENNDSQTPKKVLLS